MNLLTTLSPAFCNCFAIKALPRGIPLLTTRPPTLEPLAIALNNLFNLLFIPNVNLISFELINVFTVEDLIPKLKQISKQRKDDRIFLRADGENNYSTIMEIMGALNSSNFSNISLVTESSGNQKK